MDKAASEKSVDAYRTISEVAAELDLPQHVLRFWESRFPQLRPLKRAGGRRFYRPADVSLLRDIRALLHDQGYTIKGVQRLLRERGGRQRPEPPSSREDAADEVIDRDSFGLDHPPRSADPAAADSAPASRDAAASAGTVAERLMDFPPGGPVPADAAEALRLALATIEACERRLREALASRG